MSMQKACIALLLAVSTFGAIIVAALFSSPSQANTAVEYSIRVAPPALRSERIPDARRGYVWVPGYWNWRGRHHVWVPGIWLRERRGYVYHPHHWVQRGDAWQFNRGRWDPAPAHSHGHQR